MAGEMGAVTNLHVSPQGDGGGNGSSLRRNTASGKSEGGNAPTSRSASKDARARKRTAEGASQKAEAAAASLRREAKGSKIRSEWGSNE